MTPRPRIAVYGSSTIAYDSPDYRLARELGAALATAGADVMTGGYSGVMEAVSRGAAEGGGHVIGVTVEQFEKRGPVNAWVKERVHTPDLLERLRVLTHSADGFVVMSPSLGTLTEFHLTWTLLSTGARPPAPLVVLNQDVKMYFDLLALAQWPDSAQERVPKFARTVAEAVHLVLADAAQGSSL